ncbi:hypothetical protein CONPUDRAFT_168399, partial [Coniophora puteana RWD-64-598 SS2]
MSKTDFYLSQCIQAASKSSMTYTLGAVLVKGGKIISSGHNHHRTHYDGIDIDTHGHRKPVSMHAEMHAIYSCTGMSPSFKQQVQALDERGLQQERQRRMRGTTHPQPTEAKAKARTQQVAAQLAITPSVNGADIYVARVVKQGLGSARPCWRCVKWCYWSGVKRIFHWNASEGRFDVIKVNDLEGGCYETQADTRLFAGSCY